MARLAERALKLLARSVAVNLNSGTKQTLLTGRTGKTTVPVMVILRDFSGNASTGVVTCGRDANASDFGQSSTLTNATGATKQVIIQPIPAAAPVGNVQVAAGELFGIKPTTTVGVTCEADVLGYEYE